MLYVELLTPSKVIVYDSVSYLRVINANGDRILEASGSGVITIDRVVDDIMANGRLTVIQ